MNFINIYINKKNYLKHYLIDLDKNMLIFLFLFFKNNVTDTNNRTFIEFDLNEIYSSLNLF